jgi:hypothetical protein
MTSFALPESLIKSSMTAMKNSCFTSSLTIRWEKLVIIRTATNGDYLRIWNGPVLKGKAVDYFEGEE